MKLLFAALLLASAPLSAAEISLDLTGLPRQPVVLTAHGQTISCEGVPLAALLARAGVPAGEALRGPALASVVIAGGKDGYRVAFSLAELDARLGNHPVFVVDRCAGQPLAAADGPLRLVVPGEARAARSVRQLAGVTVVSVPE